MERLLADMFEGSAAQFLAILETLADSTRRTLLTSPAAPDTEDHILDTYSELFFAGMEIIAGRMRMNWLCYLLHLTASDFAGVRCQPGIEGPQALCVPGRDSFHQLFLH